MIKQTALYLVGAMLKQGDDSHYALGASGCGVPIALPFDNNSNAIPGRTLRDLGRHAVRLLTFEV